MIKCRSETCVLRLESSSRLGVWQMLLRFETLTASAADAAPAVRQTIKTKDPKRRLQRHRVMSISLVTFSNVVNALWFGSYVVAPISNLELHTKLLRQT